MLFHDDFVTRGWIVRIGITIGDPSGIGPELVLRTIPKLKHPGDYSVYGNREILNRTARDLRLLGDFNELRSHIIDVSGNTRFKYGVSTASTARAALQSIKGALESGADIIITAPIVKQTMRRIVPGFIGHTEYFAGFFGVSDYAMTGLWRNKRIMLLTIHMPLRHVFRKLKAGTIADRICFFQKGIRRYFGIENPEIGVSALNPHAFEFSLGEDEEIRRGIMQARRKGVRVSGPYAGDTLYNRVFDGYVAIYHDQAMVYLKSKKDGLNFTLGLPVIRLSPLYGSASDIAGKGRADITGFMAAFKTAKRLYANLKKYEKRMEYE
ncbi:MAG: 4-hydroxythreonine-4-phosphate dehydrogenase PdxA [candidate division WOR-3 bacterium]|nr:4-hydroxythreonine-4-phosphate dehydrogenase PdxA [candidate division WOR-3 bacterium]